MILEEPDFSHLPEEERPFKAQFGIGTFHTKENAPWIWVQGPLFGDGFAASCSPEDTDPEKMVKAIEDGKRSSDPCSICHIPHPSVSYVACKELTKIKELGCCYHCAFWEIQSEQGALTVIDGRVYSPGNGTSGSMRGMAGRRFDIEYLDTAVEHLRGKRITTFDLWSGGSAPLYWRCKLPDTAKFLGGATEAKAGQTICFNPSDETIPPYPLPQSIGLR